MSIIMYSTGCPRCVVLKKKLEAHNIRFSEITDVDLMLSMGIQSVPMLSVDGVLMDFASANEWLNNSVDEYNDGEGCKSCKLS